jgi:hypothetical protein
MWFKLLLWRGRKGVYSDGWVDTDTTGGVEGREQETRDTAA